ncbi:PrsW family intramembrane metalloprotease [Chloroflexi bacterium TSY]|nr:PrsW family intramembrane metalloprotease [Chloroflexi bacterium TSY]
MFSVLTISVIAAVIPTLLYAAIIYWTDRYEREPIWLLAVAFLWGAFPAILVTLIWMMLIGAPSLRASSNAYAMLTESILIAPVIEELAKAVALFGIYRWGRSEFDNALDGLVYGAMVGFGFAMTENIFYFMSAFEQGGFPSLTFLIFIRSLLFGMNHALYSGMTGIGLGLARNTTRRKQRAWFIILGLIAAIVAHALHNFGVALTALNPLNLVFSVALATVGLGVFVIAIWLNWQKERKILRTELAPEIGLTLSQSEFDRLLQSHNDPFRRLRGKVDSKQLNRNHLFAELAFRKHRNRQLGSAAEPDLPNQIAKLQSTLREGF